MRKLTSLTLLFSGIVELVTSVVLYILPAGRVAYWTDYRLLGLSKTQWTNIHLTVGTLMLAAACLHIYYNWRPLLTYLKNTKRSFSLNSPTALTALLLTAYVTVGTLAELPPMNGIIALGEHFTTSANQKYGEPPYGHAELSSLKMFTRKMDIDLETAVRQLQASKITVKNSNQTLLDIASSNGMTPQAIFAIIAPLIPTNVEKNAFPDSPPPGFGNLSMAEICDRYGLAEDQLLSRLRASGLDVQAEYSVKEAAKKNGLAPMQVFEQIHLAAKGK